MKKIIIIGILSLLQVGCMKEVPVYTQVWLAQPGWTYIKGYFCPAMYQHSDTITVTRVFGKIPSDLRDTVGNSVEYIIVVNSTSTQDVIKTAYFGDTLKYAFIDYLKRIK